MPNFFGRKNSGKKPNKEPSPEYAPFDFSTPDAFSEENMAKMGGVDTMAFDENDPHLMAELAELGWDDGDVAASAAPKRETNAKLPAGHRPRPSSGKATAAAEGGSQGGDKPLGPHQRQQSGNDLLRSLGLSLNSLGEPELTEDDLEDPDLLGELGEVSGGADFADDAGNAEALSAGGKGGRRVEDDEDGEDDDEIVEPDRESEEEESDEENHDDDGGEIDLGELESEHDFAVASAAAAVAPEKPAMPGRPPALPSRNASAESSRSGGSGGTQSKAQQEISRLEREGEALQQRAKDLRRAGDRAGALDALRAGRSVDHEASVLRTIETARQVGTVKTEYVGPTTPVGIDAPTPAPAGAGAGGGGGTPVSAELLMKQVKVLYQRAIELKKEGRTAEAMACMKRAKSLEADLMRDAHGKGLVHPGEQPGPGRTPVLRRGNSSGSGGSASFNARRSSSSSRPGSNSSSGEYEKGAGSRSSLPHSVKAAMKPKIFPVERDLFSDLEDALAAAIQLHVDRAKSLVKKDRAAAAKEVKRYKELQGKLDLAREMRVVQGARPPQFRWKITQKSRVRVLEQIAMDQMELEISRIHGMTEKTDNKGSFWIKYDLGYSKDEKIGKGVTSSFRCSEDTVDIDYKDTCFVKRARSTKMAVQNRRATFEIIHKGGMFSAAKFLGKCLVPLQPLLSSCELSVSSPILTEGRREAGGRVELAMRLRKPISSDELIVTEEKELEVGEWPAVSTEPLQPAARPPPQGAAATPTPVPAAAAASVPSKPAASAAGPPGAAGGGGGGGGESGPGQVEAAARFQNVVLTDSEKADPFAVENLDSNNVLEAEIQVVSVKAQSGDLASVMRKGALETKLLMLVSAVQSGELDLPAYCQILKERIIRDKVLAMHLKGDKRIKEAVAVMKRINAMEQELAGVPQEETEEPQAEGTP